MDAGLFLRDVLLSFGRLGRQEFSSLVQLEFVPQRFRDPLAFALRSWISTMIALGVAFYLQLDQPYWAGMAVWMVAQPTPGMAISKAFYRIVGTLGGCVAGVILISFFAQTPELFILALGLWIGACTLASNLLEKLSRLRDGAGGLYGCDHFTGSVYGSQWSLQYGNGAWIGNHHRHSLHSHDYIAFCAT